MPPKSVTLGKPEPVRAGESLQLACTAKDSNPKTTLTWYRDDNPLPDGAGKYLLNYSVYYYVFFLQNIIKTSILSRRLALGR